MILPALAEGVLRYPGPSDSRNRRRRGLVAALLCLPLLVGLHLAPAPALAQSPGVTLSGPVASEGHGTAPPEEGGTNVYHYCAVLNAAPSHDVVVTATPSPAIVTVDAALTFTPLNWSDKQCFSVRAASSADNANDEPDRAVTLSHSSSSSDSSYDGIGIGDYTAVKLRDDDPTILRLERTDSGPIYEKAGLDNKAEYTITLGRPLVAGEVVVVAHGIGPSLPPSLPGAHKSDRTITLKNGPTVSAPFRLPSGAGVLGMRVTGMMDMWIVFYGAGAQTATLEVTAVEDTLAEGSEIIDPKSCSWFEGRSRKSLVGWGHERIETGP